MLIKSGYLKWFPLIFVLEFLHLITLNLTQYFHHFAYFIDFWLGMFPLKRTHWQLFYDRTMSTLHCFNMQHTISRWVLALLKIALPFAQMIKQSIQEDSMLPNGAGVKTRKKPRREAANPSVGELSNLGPLRTKSGWNPVKNLNKREAGVGLGRELLRGQSRPIGYNDRSKALTPCMDSGQDKRAGTRDMEWVT